MASIRDLKDRIKSVGSIIQITRAMEMVATTKLRRFQIRATASRPYSEEIERLMGTLAAAVEGGDEHPLFAKRTGNKTALLVITSDRGLCGAYNSNVFAKLQEFEKQNEDRDISYYVIGKKGIAWLNRRKMNVLGYLEELVLDKMEFRDAAAAAQSFVRLFTEAKVDEVKVLYSRFESMTRYVPTVTTLLPLSADAKTEGEGAGSADLILEPDPERIFSSLVPKFLETKMFHVLIESLTSEFASRRVSMKNATDAAGDMRAELALTYNRARQEKITKEILEIASGAEAVKS